MSDAGVLGLFGLVLLAVYLLLRLRKTPARKIRPLAVIDGSNVMHWHNNTPEIGPVIEALKMLDSKGYQTGVMFDANAGYKLAGRYLHDEEFARRLGVNRDRIMVVPKGTQADPYLLRYASETGAIVISNDRFRDRITEFPVMGAPGKLVRGDWRDGKLWLDLPE